MQTGFVRGLFFFLSLCIGANALAGYRTMLDPRSMAMGGTGAAAATKFNASYHNPALIAFNRGSNPDRLFASASFGARELYNTDWDSKLLEFQDDYGFVNQDGDYELYYDDNTTAENGRALREGLRQVNLESYRKDETSLFSLLVDTDPVTLNFYTRRDIREMTVLRNRDEIVLGEEIFTLENGGPPLSGDFQNIMRSSADNTYVDISEFGVTVATTNVISYNMPISWGFTPKLMEIRGSHRSSRITEYDPQTPPDKRVSKDFLEWNVDLGFSMLMTESFLREELGLSGPLLDGEWIFSFVGMNMIPTDFTPYNPVGFDIEYPGSARAIQALYQFGVAHYRQNYMLTMDIDLTENEVYDFEGLTRFLSLGGEYYLRDDFHLRAGMRFNLAQTSEAAKDKAILTGGFMYQPRSLSIEAAAMVNEVELGGTIGIGYAF